VDVNRPWFRWRDGDLYLLLHVQPGAKTTGAETLHGGRLKLKTRAPASGGEANRAVIAFIAAEFGVVRGDVAIVRGGSHRDKELCIHTPRMLPDWFSALGGGSRAPEKVADSQGSL